MCVFELLQIFRVSRDHVSERERVRPARKAWVYGIERSLQLNGWNREKGGRRVSTLEYFCNSYGVLSRKMTSKIICQNREDDGIRPLMPNTSVVWY